MKKKIAILLIAGALSLSMVTGCSESKSEDTNKTETSVSVKKTIIVSYFAQVPHVLEKNLKQKKYPTNSNI